MNDDLMGYIIPLFIIVTIFTILITGNIFKAIISVFCGCVFAYVIFKDDYKR